MNAPNFIIRTSEPEMFDGGAFEGDLLPEVRDNAHQNVRWLWTPNQAKSLAAHREEKRQQRDARRIAQFGAHRTAITTSTDPMSDEQVDAGMPTFNSSLIRAVTNKGARGSQVDGISFGTEILGEELAEGAEYTGASQTVQGGGFVGPKWALSVVGASRQWLREADQRTMLDVALATATGRPIEAHIGLQLATSTLIATSAMGGAPAAPSRAKLVALMQAAADVGVDPANGVFITSKAGYAKAALTVENNNYLATGGLMLDRPVIVTTGIPENLGTGTNETAILFGDPRAVTLFHWGVYTIEDPYTSRKKGLVELAHGAFYRAVIRQPKRLVRLTGVATS